MLFFAPAEPFDDVERDRDEKTRYDRIGEHADDDDRAERAPRRAAGARRDPQRRAAQDERDRSHEQRPAAQSHSLESGFHQPAALFGFHLGELDDQDRVLRREADEDDEADLRVDVGTYGASTGRKRRRRPRSAP